MKFVYGQKQSHIIPNCNDWKATTKLPGLKPRSGALKRVDTALQQFNAVPGKASFNTLKMHFNQWYQSKLVAGKFKSERGDAPEKLKTMIYLYDKQLTEQVKVKAYLEDKIKGCDWDTKATWGEIYETQKKDQYGTLKDHVEDMEWEARISSGWAMNPPDTVSEWAKKGDEEINRLQAWPQLADGRAGLSARMHPKGNGWPKFNFFVRKGVFCHSSAAIAASFLLKHKSYINSNFPTCSISSIDIIQQAPAQKAEMCHWWVCVNRPDKIILNNNTISVTSFSDFEKYLPLTGGFVIDIWGAMFEPQNQFTAWSSVNAIANPAVIDVPEKNFLGRTHPRVAARWVL